MYSDNDTRRRRLATLRRAELAPFQIGKVLQIVNSWAELGRPDAYPYTLEYLNKIGSAATEIETSNQAKGGSARTVDMGVLTASAEAEMHVVYGDPQAMRQEVFAAGGWNGEWNDDAFAVACLAQHGIQQAQQLMGGVLLGE